jgi:carbonic anhydrase
MSLVLVLGHQNCGAITAKLRGDTGISSKNMSSLLQKIEVKNNHNYLETIAYNAFVQSKRITTESSIISELVKQDQVVIKSAIYNMSSRMVELN